MGAMMEEKFRAAVDPLTRMTRVATPVLTFIVRSPVDATVFVVGRWFTNRSPAKASTAITAAIPSHMPLRDGRECGVGGTI